MAVQDLRPMHPLRHLLRAARLRRATFYYHLKKLSIPDPRHAVKEQIKAIYHENKGRYGYRRITAELRRRGSLINHKTVQRLMKVMGISCRVRLKKYRSYRGEEGEAAPNLLKRDFEAQSPNQKWVTDVTEFKLHGKKLYLSPILDLYDQSIISYSLSESPALSLVMNMLKEAFKEIPDGTGLILHSDSRDLPVLQMLLRTDLSWDFDYHMRYRKSLKDWHRHF